MCRTGQSVLDKHSFTMLMMTAQIRCAQLYNGAASRHRRSEEAAELEDACIHYWKANKIVVSEN
jgi:hypothetical protein